MDTDGNRAKSRRNDFFLIDNFDGFSEKKMVDVMARVAD